MKYWLVLILYLLSSFLQAAIAFTHVPEGGEIHTHLVARVGALGIQLYLVLWDDQVVFGTILKTKNF